MILTVRRIAEIRSRKRGTRSFKSFPILEFQSSIFSGAYNSVIVQAILAISRYAALGCSHRPSLQCPSVQSRCLASKMLTLDFEVICEFSPSITRLLAHVYAVCATTSLCLLAVLQSAHLCANQRQSPFVSVSPCLCGRCSFAVKPFTTVSTPSATAQAAFLLPCNQSCHESAPGTPSPPLHEYPCSR